MRVLIATDAWYPQVNGVLRTLTALQRAARNLGVTVEFLSPDGHRTVPVPTYPGLRLAVPRRSRIVRRIEESRPDAIHIATEGPIGHAVRAYCRRRGRPFTTSYTTRFPEYISARVPVPEQWIYAALRRFHAAATVTMVATPSLMSELGERGFNNLGMWTRGVDTELFRPDRAIVTKFPRPIFICVGRVALEKNLEAFLSLDLPGTKVVVGKGPMEVELKARFPAVKFLGQLENGALAGHLAAADVFVFPSLHRYVRHRATRGIGERRADRSISRHRAEGRHRHSSDRHAERRSARRLSRSAASLTRGVPGFRTPTLLGAQCAAIHRACPQGRHGRCSHCESDRAARPGARLNQ